MEVEVQGEEKGESMRRGCVLRKRCLTEGERGEKIKTLMLENGNVLLDG